MKTEMDTSSLPFNTSLVAEQFTLLKPSDVFHEGPGAWLLLNKSSLLVREESQMRILRWIMKRFGQQTYSYLTEVKSKETP